MRKLIFITTVIISLFSFGQENYLIKDLQTKEVIPFVKIIPSNEEPKISNFNGEFSLKNELSTVTLKAIGYRDSIYYLDARSEKTLFLKAQFQQIGEVSVVAGENPAQRIIQQAIDNRKKNNPEGNDPYKITVYNKFHLTIDPSLMDSIPENVNDSVFMGYSKIIDSMHLLMIESITEKKFMPLNKKKEIIKSHKVSGINDPLFATIFSQMQSFSFYENQFEILGKSYINPIAFGGINRYLFIIEDTTINAIDTTFLLSFRPRKGKNFDGLKGQLFINTNGFAIEKVIAEPYQKDSVFNIKIIQEYQFLENKRWFPIKLSTEFEMKNEAFVIENKAGIFLGKSYSYISDINLDPKLTRKDFDQIDLETEFGAENKSEEEWNNKRKYLLTDQEKNTYKVVDSIAKAENFDKYFRVLKISSTGKIPLGRFNIDFSKLLAYNDFEGTRLGLGLENSDKLMKRITIGAYGGYGFKDKTFKYGGYSIFNLAPKKNLSLKLSYSYDVLERGGNILSRNINKFDLVESSRKIYLNKMDYQQKAEIEFIGYLMPRVRLSLFATYQRLNISDDYQYLNPKFNLISSENPFDIAEIGAQFFWQYGEKIIQLAYQRTSIPSKAPKVNLKIAKAFPSIFDSKMEFYRLYLKIDQLVSLRGFGTLNWSLVGSKTFGDAPLPYLQSTIGTNGKARVSVPNTFETVQPGAFFADEQAALFTKLSLLTWKTKLKFFQPMLSFHHAIGFSNMQNKSYHNQEIKTMNKGYYEGGIILDKLYVSNFSGFGVGIFANYGVYSLPQFEKNLVFKLSFSFNF